MTRRRWHPAVALAAVLALVGCSPAAQPVPPPQPQAQTTSPTPTPTPQRQFTVATTEAYDAADPVAVTSAMATSLNLNVFQRLMTAPAGENVLKPDAARDCIFQSETTYVCTLQKDLFFANGHRLTSSDVKFSIERAQRLGVQGSSAPLLSTIRGIETPDDVTVRFLLKRVDTQFGFALASPAASIVDEQLYKADEIRPVSKGAVGSGPFIVGEIDGSRARFDRFGGYKGPYGTALQTVIVQRFADSGAIEEAMRGNAVDAVWRGLSPAALTRLDAEIAASDDRLTATGFGRATLAGARVVRLFWRPGGPHRSEAPQRVAVSALLQEDRTLPSLVPAGLDGYAAVFAMGGAGGANLSWDSPVELTLAHDAGSPGLADQALLLQSRLESSGGFRVEIVDRPDRADLVLTDRPAWTWTSYSWLAPYLEHPAMGSNAHVTQLATDYAKSTLPDEGVRLLTEIQKQAAADAVVLPVSQGDEQVFLGPAVTLAPTAFGPSWQLGLWGFGR